MGRIPKLQIQVFYLLRTLPWIDNKRIANYLGSRETRIKTAMRGIRKRMDLDQYCPRCFSKWTSYDGSYATCHKCGLAIVNQTHFGGYIWCERNFSESTYDKNRVTGRFADICFEGMTPYAVYRIRWKRVLRNCRDRMQKLIEDMRLGIEIDENIMSMLSKRMQGFVYQYPLVKIRSVMYDQFIVETLLLATNFDPAVRHRLTQYFCYRILKHYKIRVRRDNKDRTRAIMIQQKALEYQLGYKPELWCPPHFR